MPRFAHNNSSPLSQVTSHSLSVSVSYGTLDDTLELRPFISSVQLPQQEKRENERIEAKIERTLET